MKKIVLGFVLLSSLFMVRESEATLGAIALGGSALINGVVSVGTGIGAGFFIKSAADCFQGGVDLAKKANDSTFGIPIALGAIAGYTLGGVGILFGTVSVVTGASSVMSAVGFFAKK